MKRVTLAILATAAVLAAQTPGNQTTEKPGTPPQILGTSELADIIVVEEQEGDLARAERLYRDALDHGDLTTPARTLANLRLGRLLERLGRDEDARPFLEAFTKASFVPAEAIRTPAQDPEREAELRAKARELVREVLDQKRPGRPNAIYGIELARVAEQLLWLGEAAIPELIAALQELASRPQRSQTTYDRVAALASALWRIGGEQAAGYLSSAVEIDDEAFRHAVVVGAFQAQDEQLIAVATRFLADPAPDGAVVRTLLRSGTGLAGYRTLGEALPADRIVEGALAGPDNALRPVLEWAQPYREISLPVLARLHARVRKMLESTDPELGSAAQTFLMTATSQRSAEGTELLLHELPRIGGRNSPAWRQPLEFTGAEARRLLEPLDAAVRACAPPVDSQLQQWSQQMMWSIASAHGPGCEATVLGWIDLGYDVWGVLKGRIGVSEIRPAIEHIRSSDIVGALDAMGEGGAVPAAVFELLRAKAEELRTTVPGFDADGIYAWFRWPMVRTRNPGAATWLVEQWREHGKGEWVIDPLLELGRHDQGEVVRNALFTVASGGTEQKFTPVLLALMSMGDERALDVVAATLETAGAFCHPYSRAEPDRQLLVRPIQYLLDEEPDPPHGYTDAQIHGLLRQNWRRNGLDQQRFSAGRIPDRHFAALAGLRSDWSKVLLERWRDRSLPAERRAALRATVVELLRSADDSQRVFILRSGLNDSDARALRSELVELIGDDSVDVARAAVSRLTGAGLIDSLDLLGRLAVHPDDLIRRIAADVASRFGAEAEAIAAPLVTDPDANVRGRAIGYLGAIVSTQAVPALIAALRDPSEGVRQAAADALTRIRFYQEQQAHWDRVLKGLDASPASAADKLLLQAR
ncbi:MAG: HEAT repeat domain-containing protein, partial [Planctomycetes bacterium]|nr:HEAT repeat domain-containing protein [Planctomycetota bacterium]